MDDRTDAELLAALRRGDPRAYSVLWERHSAAAHRYALRVAPSRAEDLVSESFLAIYQQVTTTDAGPQFAFRSYLKAVIRNTAIRWAKDASQLVLTDEVDSVDERDALSIAQADSDATDVLAALQALPERWQRVLWLAEVVQARRQEIAHELKIKPNAVSALQRRARAGLKHQWLIRQVPVALRDDPAHVARLFPQYLTEPDNGAVAAEVNLHVAICAECRTLLDDTRGAAARIGSSTLAVLLGTAGIGAATATLSSATTATALAVVAAGGAAAWLIGGGVAAATAGSLVISSLFTVGPVLARPVPTMPPAASTTALPTPSGSEREGGTPSLGRTPVAAPGQADPADQAIGLTDDPTHYFPAYQYRPTPATGVPDPAPVGPDPTSTPDPTATSNPGTVPGGGVGPGTVTPLSGAGVTSPATSSAYISPVISGRTTPGNSVAVQVDTRRFTPAVAPDGTWSLDTRGLELVAGDYNYQAWAYTTTMSSTAVTGTFTVLPLVVRGFENITGFSDMTAAEAKTTGLIVEFQGPVNGVVYVQTMEGNTSLVALDGNGYAKRRLLVNSYGWYWFTMRYLDGDGYMGPAWEHNLDVYDPTIPYDPMGPAPEDMTFQFVVP